MSPVIKGALCIATLLGLATPAVAQSFEERWGLVPKAHAAEPPSAESAKPEPNTAEPAQNGTGATPRSTVEEDHATQQTPSPSRPVAPKQAQHGRRGVLIGRASFYAYRHGKTASGAPFDRDGMTAASRTLPLGTRLRVTDLKTSKSVEVIVTDRGPASKHRILDLSLGAAHALGMSTRGIVQVRAEIIS